jgi:hypothetical protein
LAMSGSDSNATCLYIFARRSHLAVPPSSNALQDFTFPTLDFSKLLQLHELHEGIFTPQGGGGGGGAPASSSSSSPARRSATAGTPTTSGSLMEESYVDAGQAAASLLNLDAQPVQQRKETRAGGTPSKGGLPAARSATSNATHSRSSGAPIDRRTTSAGKTGSTATASGAAANQATSSPVSLDFLRQRGQKEAARASGSSGGGAGRSTTADTTAMPASRPRVHSSAQQDPPTGAGAGAGAGRSEKAREVSTESKSRNSKDKASSSSSSAAPASPRPLSSESTFTSASPSGPISASVSAGTVIFNGKEVGTGGSSRSGRRKVKEQAQAQSSTQAQTRAGDVEGRTSLMRGALGRTGLEGGRAEGARYASPTPRSTTTTTSTASAGMSTSATAHRAREDKGKGKSVQSDETDEWDVV